MAMILCVQGISAQQLPALVAQQHVDAFLKAAMHVHREAPYKPRPIYEYPDIWPRMPVSAHKQIRREYCVSFTKNTGYKTVTDYDSAGRKVSEILYEESGNKEMQAYYKYEGDQYECLRINYVHSTALQMRIDTLDLRAVTAPGDTPMLEHISMQWQNGYIWIDSTLYDAAGATSGSTYTDMDSMTYRRDGRIRSILIRDSLLPQSITYKYDRHGCLRSARHATTSIAPGNLYLVIEEHKLQYDKGDLVSVTGTKTIVNGSGRLKLDMPAKVYSYDALHRPVQTRYVGKDENNPGLSITTTTTFSYPSDSIFQAVYVTSGPYEMTNSALHVYDPFGHPTWAIYQGLQANPFWQITKNAYDYY